MTQIRHRAVQDSFQSVGPPVVRVRLPVRADLGDGVHPVKGAVCVRCHPTRKDLGSHTVQLGDVEGARTPRAQLEGRRRARPHRPGRQYRPRAVVRRDAPASAPRTPPSPAPRKLRRWCWSLAPSGTSPRSATTWTPLAFPGSARHSTSHLSRSPSNSASHQTGARALWE